MNTIRPRYPQQTQGYQTKQNTTDQDGHNQNAQDQQQQRQQQVVARGRAEDVQNQGQPIEQRKAIYSPASNAYPSAFPNQRQTYAVSTPPTIRHNSPTPLQYQAYQQQSGYQPINQPAQQAPSQPVRSNRVNIAQILKDFRNIDPQFLKHYTMSLLSLEVDPNKVGSVMI